jgi:hypothetical protein
VKEAKPIDYLTKVLPLLLQNGVVHLLGFGNRLGFDPLPSRLQVKDIASRFKYYRKDIRHKELNVNKNLLTMSLMCFNYSEIPLHLLGKVFSQV